jgi:hypothetical protein
MYFEAIAQIEAQMANEKNEISVGEWIGAMMRARISAVM